MSLTHILNRFGRKLKDIGKTLFRALGLNIVSSLFILLRFQAIGKGYAEQTKVAIRRHRATALLRALIHVIPMGVAIWEVTLNWNTYFVGYQIYNLAYYQFGAKLHEIAIQASLSSVVFSYVRYELMLGDGIPFGALFSGLQMSQASYLWSMEYWGTMWSKNITLKTKLRLVFVVTASIFLAAVTGPSSAILLVPRSDYWPAGSTNIWVNVTSDDLWPDSIDAFTVPKHCVNADVLDIYNFGCPSHGWEAVQDFLYITVDSQDTRYPALSHEAEFPKWVEVPGHGSQRRLSITQLHGSPEGFDQAPFVATIQQSVIADALTETGTLWSDSVSSVSASGHGSVLRRQDAIHTIKNGYRQPYVITSCANDVINGPFDNRKVAFPVPPGDLRIWALNRTRLNDSILGVFSYVHPTLTREQLLNTAGPSETTRIKWVELPQDPFNGSAIGAIISLPRSSANVSQEILACTLGAGWGSSLLNTSSHNGGTTFTASVAKLQDKAVTPLNRSDSENDALTNPEYINDSLTNAIALPFFPEKSIIISEAWANYMNPFVSALNTTVIDVLMSTTRPAQEFSRLGQVGIAGWALAGLLANGLANIGSTSSLQGELKTVSHSNGFSDIDGDFWFSGKGDIFIVDPEESKGWVKLRVDTTIEGYSYNMRGAGPKVAVSFLLAYCLIALAHILYAGISGISSTCWDSIGEVTALAMSSTPATVFRNTCAAIMELNIFKLPVRVLAIRDEEGDGEHLELCFRGGGRETSERDSD